MWSLYVESFRVYCYVQYRTLKIICGLEQCSLLWINEKCQSANLGGSAIIMNRNKQDRRACLQGIASINTDKARR